MKKAALLALALGLAALACRQSPRPDLLIVTVEGLPAEAFLDPGALGTPTLGALAGDGVLFPRGFTPSPVLLPSHGSLFTAVLPADHGAASDEGAALPARLPTLAQVLTDNGTACAAAVSRPALRASSGLSRGFSTYQDAVLFQPRSGNPLLGPAGHVPASLASVLRPAADTTAAALEHDPFAAAPAFLFLHFATSGTTEDNAAADRALGGVIARLKQSGRYENCVIVVAAPYGPASAPFGTAGYGCDASEGTVRVPIFFKAPAIARALRGRERGETVSLADITPTVLGLLGINAGGAATPFEGTDWSGALSDGAWPDGARPLTGESGIPDTGYGWPRLRYTQDGPVASAVPGDADRPARLARYRAAEAAFAAGREDEGVAILDRLITEDPGELRAVLERASLAMDGMDLAGAEKLLLGAGGTYENNFLFLRALLRLRMLSGDLPAVQKTLDRMVERFGLMPELIPPQVRLYQSTNNAGALEAYLQRAEAALGPHPEVILATLQALGPKAGAEAFQTLIGRRLVRPGLFAGLRTYLEGSLALLEGKEPQALPLFQRSCALGAEFYQPYFNAGTILKKSGDLEAALGHFRAALVLRPDNARALYEAAETMAMGGNLPGATAAFARAALLEPGNLSIRIGLIKASWLAGERAGARRLYRELAAKNPKELAELAAADPILALVAAPGR